MPRRPPAPVATVAAIDVGTNAVRLEIARVLADGALETLHQQRDAIRPGEGMFKTGAMPGPVVERLVATMRRYGALIRHHRAQVRAVATSAVREARNRADIVRRIREEAGVELEVISGREEARLICLGVLHGRPASSRSLVIDIGGGSTEVAFARGERPVDLWSVELGSVRFTELFDSTGTVKPRRLQLMRDFAAEIFARGVPREAVPHFRSAFGSSGTINALVAFAADEDSYPKVSARRLSRAVEQLAAMSPSERRTHFDPRRAEIIVGGAVVLEQVVLHLGLEQVIAVDRGLRNGILFELVRQAQPWIDDHAAINAAAAMAERFGVDLPHARQVARIACTLFDGLEPLHQLPASSRPLLEAAALLHDVGHAVSHQRHHKHTYYLIRNADLAGLSERERELVALIARFHRRSAPERKHPDLVTLRETEFRIVRKLSTILRLSDALDRGHHQSVRALSTALRDGVVQVGIRARAPVDLELWDAEHDAALFRRVFGRRLEFVVKRRAR